MARILALVGSGEFTESMIEIDKFLLSHLENPHVVIIPTAAGREKDYAKWINKGVSHFENLGAKAEGVHIIKKSDARGKKVLDHLARSNFYYFSGGDPGYLLDTIKNTPAWELIYRNYNHGAILAGSSAGAMVLGSMVWSRVYEFADYGKLLPWEEGLGVVSFGVIPHYDYIKKEFNHSKINEMKKLFPIGVKILGIHEDTAYIQINDLWKTLGKGKVDVISLKESMEAI